MPTPRWGLGVGEVNGVLYAVGGGSNTRAVEAYDPASDSWTAKKSMTATRQDLGVGVVNGILYAVGGGRGGSLETVEAYDPRTDTWTTKVNLPTPRMRLAVGVVNDILYAVGGDNISGYLATVEAYDPVTGIWTTKAPMPTARSGLAVGVVNGILYAIGGNGMRTTVEAYDPATDTWTTKAPMPTGRRSLAVGVVNGIIYALGGEGQPGFLATVEAYDPATDTWTTKPSMINPRESLGAGVVNGVLYAIGGYNYSGFEPVAPVEAYESGAPPDAPAWPNEPTGLVLFNDQPWNSLTGSGWHWLRRASSKDPDIVTDGTALLSPQSVLRMIFTDDMGQDQEPSVHWIGLPGVKEIYTGWWLKLSPNWTSSPAGAGKMTFLFTNESGQAYTSLYHPCVWPENCDPEQTGPPYKVGANLEWAPYDSVWYPNLVATPINPGEWHRIEFYYRWETTPAARDGILRWWVDGTLNGDYTDVQYPVDDFIEFQYAPTLQDPPPSGVETYMYIDHTHISTPP